MTTVRRGSLPIPDADEYPTHSILLNGQPSPEHVERPGRGRSSSSVSSSSALTSSSYAPSSSSKVSFAPLPQVPSELKRRNSITLGVAARKNLLIQQGSAPPSQSRGGGVKQVYMTDDEWEEYKRAFDRKNGADAVDLGELAKSGAKNLWRKVRPSSASSPTSQSSASSLPSPTPSDVPKIPASPRKLFGRRASGSAPPRTPDVLGFTDPRAQVESLGTVHEEPRSGHTSPHMQGLQLTVGSPGLESQLGMQSGGRGDDAGERGADRSHLTRYHSPPPIANLSVDDDEEDGGQGGGSRDADTPDERQA